MNFIFYFVSFLKSTVDPKENIIYSKFEMDFRKQILFIIENENNIEIFDDFFLFLESKLHINRFNLMKFFCKININAFTDQKNQKNIVKRNKNYTYSKFKNERFFHLFQNFLEQNLKNLKKNLTNSIITLGNNYNFLLEKTIIFHHKNNVKLYFYSQKLEKNDIEHFVKNFKEIKYCEFTLNLCNFFSENYLSTKKFILKPKFHFLFKKIKNFMEIFWYLDILKFDIDEINKQNDADLKTKNYFELSKQQSFYKISNYETVLDVSILQLLNIIYLDITYYANESLKIKSIIDNDNICNYDLNKNQVLLENNLTLLQYSLNSIVSLLNQNKLTYEMYNPLNSLELRYNFFNSKLYDCYTICIQENFFIIAKLLIDNKNLKDDRYKITKAGFFYKKKIESIKFFKLLSLMDIMKDKKFLEIFFNTYIEIYKFIFAGLFADNKIEFSILETLQQKFVEFVRLNKRNKNFNLACCKKLLDYKIFINSIVNKKLE